MIGVWLTLHEITRQSAWAGELTTLSANAGLVGGVRSTDFVARLPSVLFGTLMIGAAGWFPYCRQGVD